MLYFRRSPFLRVVVLPLALVAFLSACSGPKWVGLKPPIERSLVDKRPQTVRLTLVNDSVHVVGAPTVEGDTLFGRDKERMVPTGVVRDGVAIREHPRVSIPLEEIQRAEMQKGTSVAVPLLVSLVLAVWLMASVGRVRSAF